MTIRIVTATVQLVVSIAYLILAVTETDFARTVAVVTMYIAVMVVTRVICRRSDLR